EAAPALPATAFPQTCPCGSYPPPFALSKPPLLSTPRRSSGQSPGRVPAAAFRDRRGPAGPGRLPCPAPAARRLSVPMTALPHRCNRPDVRTGRSIDRPPPWRWMCAAFLALATLLAPATVLAAIGMDDLLPVDEAFVLRVDAGATGGIKLEWTIAEGYYLYRHRMGAEPLDDGFRADPAGLQLPPGTPYTDEFFGDVETYRGRVAGLLAGTATAARTELKIRYQGCADVGICYPPQTRTVAVTLPAAAAAAPRQADSGFAALGQALGAGATGGSATLASAGVTGALPLPEAQAFAFEAIADGGDTLLMRFTPAPGYYLYRDRSSFTLKADGIQAGTPRWPRGVAHHDEYFGEVVVYFDQINVPLPLRRSHGAPREATLTATFQGCQDGGICYPPMTRSVRLSPPASTADTGATAGATTVASDATTTGAANGPATIDGAGAANARAAAAGNPDAPDAAAADASAPLDGTPGATADATADNAARSSPPATAGGGGLGLALLLALAGGILLNLMPCVLPILSLKVLGLAEGGASRAHARRQALWYTAGVLVAFAVVGLAVLALRAAGQALGW